MRGRTDAGAHSAHGSTIGGLALAAFLLAIGRPASAAADPLVDLQAAGWASSCVTCHGDSRAVPGSEIPRLAGRPADRIVAYMIEAAADRRGSLLMQQIARGYDRPVIERIAKWYEALPKEDE